MRNNYEWSYITRCKAKIADPIHYIFIFIDSLQPFFVHMTYRLYNCSDEYSSNTTPLTLKNNQSINYKPNEVNYLKAS